MNKTFKRTAMPDLKKNVDNYFDDNWKESTLIAEVSK